MITIAKTQVAINFYRQMHKRILLGKFKNDKIPGVRQLAEEAGLSVPSVMEGIDLLEEKNVVWRRQGSGIYINGLDQRQLEVTVLQADYPSGRFEMLNRAVEQLCTQKNYCYERRIVPVTPLDYRTLPDFADVIIYIAPAQALNPLWLAEVENRCGILILLDKHPGNLDIDAIAIDNKSMVLQALDYLYARGHSHIWYLHNSPEIYDVVIRYFAAARWAVDHDVRLEHLDCHVASGDDGYRKAMDTLILRLQQADHVPTAILAINEAGSLAAVHAAEQCGRLVPGNLSVIGLNDSPEVAGVGITVVADQQKDFMRALDVLIRKRIYEKCGQVLNLKIPGLLVERQSVRPL